MGFKPTRDEHWELFKEYCRKDVEACREIYKRLPPILNREEALWVLDQEINDRGYCIDLELARNADKCVAQVMHQLDQEIRDLTEGKMYSARCVSALLEWLLVHENIVLSDLQESTILNVLQRRDLSVRATQLLHNRLDASRSAPRKLQTLLKATSTDGRLRGTLQFYGASRTGRWAGRVFQPQNLPRPKKSHQELEQIIANIPESVTSHSDPLQTLSDCVRSCIIASKGKKLIVADLSGIEARVLAWLAGEQWKLDAFTRGDDIYKLAYAKAFNIPVSSVTKNQRAIGKVMELALGYQGGARVFQTMASNLGLDLQHFSKNVKQTASLAEWEKSEERCTWMQTTHPEFAVQDLFIGTACELVKTAWRTKHKGIVALWKDCQEAVDYALIHNHLISARRCPNVPPLLMKKHHQNLVITLPSKRSLVYVDVKSDRSYLNTTTSQLMRERTYGGKLVENIVQAISRDVLVNGMWNAYLMGYDIVLTVHDEIVCETPDTQEFSVEGLCSLMSETPLWARGLPLKAEGYEAMRYRK